MEVAAAGRGQGGGGRRGGGGEAGALPSGQASLLLPLLLWLPLTVPRGSPPCAVIV